jgi:DNA polymerase-3 subunit gamma/tau
MAYEPLHHKYRPATFADLVGQEAITNTLTSAIRQQRIAPAYLFSGPRGTGKTSSARILAKSLNCEASDRPTATPCGQCEICRSITNGSAVDVIEIDAASNTGVDNIRELIERAQFAPVKCRYKVYAVDECHMLSTAAFNSLLKTLEEPPDRVVFVLATTDPQRVLPTIISRCQRFDYRRIRLDAMVDHLAHIATIEQIDVSPEALTLVAQIAQGGMRDAESLLDQLSLLDERIMPQHVWDLVGAVPERDLLDVLRSIASDRPEAVLDCCRSMLDRGREPLTVLQSLANFYRDFLIAKTAIDRQSLTSVTSATWPELCEFAQGWSVEQILLGGQHLRSCESQIKNTTQPRLWLEVSLLGLLPSAIAARSGGGVPIVPGRAAAPMTPAPQWSAPAAAPAYPQPSAYPPPAQSAPPAPPAPIEPLPASPAVAPPVASPTPIAPPATAPIPDLPASISTPIATPPSHPAPVSLEEDDRPDWDAIDPDMSPDVPATRTEYAAPPHTASPYTAPTHSPPQSNLNGGTSATPPPAPAAPAAPAPPPQPTVETQVFNLPQVWQQVLSHLQMRATRELLNQKCRLSAFDGQTARISVLASAIQPVVKRKQGDIEAAFSYVFGMPIGIAIDIAADAQTPAPTVDPRQPPSAAPTPASLPPAPAPPFSAPAPAAPAPTFSAPPPAPTYSAPAPIAPPPSPPTAPVVSPPPVPSAPAIVPDPPAQATTPPPSTPPPIAPPLEVQPAMASMGSAPIGSASGRQWDESEIASAAQQLANFFGGEVVTLDEDVLN